jgi:hypothetical protein
MNGHLFQTVCGALAAVAISAPLHAQTPPPVEADPIRCWWRTSANSVRVGEPFSLVLTCAVLENDTVQVVPDEGRLAPSAIQLAPFETIEGRHPEDLRTADRRFFQYEYRLRVVSADQIGRDVPIPDVVLHYRVNSKLENNAAVQGRDRTYLMPPASVRVLSLVPVNATDIRDAADESFSTIDAIRFRSNLLEIAAAVLAVLGIVMVAVALVRIITLARQRRGVDDTSPGLSHGGVLRLAGRELAEVQREREASGWSEPLVARALAAARVTAAAALGRETSQRLIDLGPDGESAAAEGDLTQTSRRGKQVRVSSPVTGRDVARRLTSLPQSAPAGRRQMLEHLQDALIVLTTAQYSRDVPSEPGPLDQAVGEVVDALAQLKSAEMWPKPQLRRLLGQHADAR